MSRRRPPPVGSSQSPTTSKADYERELFQAAEEAGLVLREQDGRIFSYPVLVRILRGGDAGVVTVDKKRTRLLRPSALIAHLRELRERPPKSNSAQFLQALFETYRRATASRPGAVVELIDLYDLMTLFPGLRREYSRGRTPSRATRWSSRHRPVPVAPVRSGSSTRRVRNGCTSA
jgi:hypothetical protein